MHALRPICLAEYSRDVLCIQVGTIPRKDPDPSEPPSQYVAVRCGEDLTYHKHSSGSPGDDVQKSNKATHCCYAFSITHPQSSQNLNLYKYCAETALYQVFEPRFW